MDIKKDREYRRFETFEIRSAEDNPVLEDSEMIVQGYALLFDQPTVLYESKGIEYKEVIDKNALKDTDLTDVILNYDHAGKVMARTRNKTLELKVDSKGLHIRADLSGTEEGRNLYEEISGGYIDKMSFSFVASSSEYDPQTYTRTITGIKRLYDVSAVSIPAYQTTSISARSFFEAVAEQERKVDAERRAKLKLQSFILGGLKK